MRRQDDLGMRPERAVRRKRLIGEDVERCGAERAVVEALQDIGFVLQPAAPGIDQDGRTERTIPVELYEQFPVQDVPRIRCERQQADRMLVRCRNASICALP